MKQITLSKQALRILGMQLEGKGDGYTAKQSKILDKTIDVINAYVADYNKTLDDYVKDAQDQFIADPSKKVQIEKEANDRVNSFIETQGKATVPLKFEDQYFDFIKSIWDSIQGFSGDKVTRKAVVEIEDALANPTDVPLTAETKKNDEAN